MAIMLGISPGTFYNWQKQHPEFLKWVKDGQTDKKARLRASAYMRAFGFTMMEEKVFCNAEGKITTHSTPKYYPPSDTMLIFLLCNQLPEEFKHVQHIQNSGGVDVNLKNTIPAAFAHQMDRVLAAMGEKRVGQAPASRPAPAPTPSKPKKAAPASSQDLEDEEEIPLQPSPLDEDPNPPTDLDLSDLESGDE
ncbi:MAG TPA: hypothetical protein VK465_01440 [Fibrobacteria bacterium]|nr:hypothetical protein [Fibrobacteria bacterium]